MQKRLKKQTNYPKIAWCCVSYKFLGSYFLESHLPQPSNLLEATKARYKRINCVQFRSPVIGWPAVAHNKGNILVPSNRKRYLGDIILELPWRHNFGAGLHIRFLVLWVDCLNTSIFLSLVIIRRQNYYFFLVFPTDFVLQQLSALTLVVSIFIIFEWMLLLKWLLMIFQSFPWVLPSIHNFQAFLAEFVVTIISFNNLKVDNNSKMQHNLLKTHKCVKDTPSVAIPALLAYAHNMQE